MSKKVLFIIFCFMIIGVLLFYLSSKNKIISIYYTVDLQGFITPHEDYWTNGKPLAGGSASLAAYIEKESKFARRRDIAFFLVDTGNFFAGQAEGYLFKGSSVIEIMNMLGYDAMAIGPKDFAFGEENLRDLAKEARFPFLSANLVKEDTGETVDYIRPYIIKEYKGVKIAIIGITNPLIFSENIKDIEILNPILTARKYVSSLNNTGVSLIVILSNLGLEEDKRLAREVEGINVIIGGNDHGGWRELRPFYVEPKNKTVIVESWEKGGCYGIDIILDKQRKIKKYKSKIKNLLIKDFKPKTEIQAIVRKYTELLIEEKKKVIGYAQTELTRAKDRESPLGDWVADILRQKIKADISLVGGLQADIKQGEITIGDVYNVLPIIDRLEVVGFNVALIKLSGEKIRDILEHSVGWALENERGILQVSGLKMIYDPKSPQYHRVKDITIDGQLLEPDRIYKVAVNGYLASGGDRYYDIQFAENRLETGIMAFDVLVEYIKTHSPITAPALEGRIVRLE